MRLHEADSPVDGATLRLNQTPTQIAAFASQSHCLVWLIQAGSNIERQVLPRLDTSSTVLVFLTFSLPVFESSSKVQV